MRKWKAALLLAIAGVLALTLSASADVWDTKVNVIVNDGWAEVTTQVPGVRDTGDNNDNDRLVYVPLAKLLELVGETDLRYKDNGSSVAVRVGFGVVDIPAQPKDGQAYVSLVDFLSKLGFSFGWVPGAERAYIRLL